MPTAALHAFETHHDVGDIKHPGDCTYDAARQEYIVSGAGKNMWLGNDEFHFAWKQLTGDFIVTANVAFIGQGVDPHRKLGWTARATLDSHAVHATAVVHGDGLTSLQFRRTLEGMTDEVRSKVVAPDVIQLERRGRNFILSAAKDGEEFVVEQITLNVPETLYVGLFVCSHNVDVVEQAVFHNVRIVRPAWTGLTPYRDYLGSRLETIDVDTGRRTLVYETPDPIEAPNWTPDGKHLIYNSRGKLYRFDLATRSSTLVDTGFATRNNNDHVLSFDGTMLGISHHPPEDGGKSVIYTLPASGGTPKRITARSPSYLHGWSPDGKFLTYTAERNGDYDIYRISADGGEETQLTTAPGLDDGSEYSPDGKFIYFNSVRSGLMQLWWMNADGSDQRQLTDDAHNNWFPHISPDGKRIVFLSYMEAINPSEHPYYKHVALRSMPISGGVPRVLAYLYGGQGTLNVPSWSPDSRHVAFVSNTAM